jgi:hypothetical protein
MARSRSAASRYLESLAQKIDAAIARLPAITRLAENLAKRHERGGLIGFPWIGTTLEQELFGRAGGAMHISFDRPWKKRRTAAEKANDAMIFAWDTAPAPGALERVREARAKGMFVIGFGPTSDPEVTAACDAWIESGGEDLSVGKTHPFVNALNGWLLIGEYVAALTRRGKMPTMWKAGIAVDGKEWADRYFGKVQFHDDFRVAPQPAGEIAGRYLARIGHLVARLGREELDDLRGFAAEIAAELRAGRKTTVASSGHMAMNWIGRFADAAWAENHEVHGNVDFQMKSYEKDTPDGALVLRLDAHGLHPNLAELLQRKRQRVLLITSENPRPEYSVPAAFKRRVDLGFAFGDGCIWITGYPIPILPASGLMQVAAYEAISAEVLAD